MKSLNSLPTDDDPKETKTIEADVSKYAGKFREVFSVEWPFEAPLAVREAFYILHTSPECGGSLIYALRKIKVLLYDTQHVFHDRVVDFEVTASIMSLER